MEVSYPLRHAKLTSASKTLAERAFWDFFKTPRSFDGVALNPALVRTPGVGSLTLALRPAGRLPTDEDPGLERPARPLAHSDDARVRPAEGVLDARRRARL